jgi:NAD(P)-dependent dehydrogenase (short-subunit alcohol dehydrogenase family)
VTSTTIERLFGWDAQRAFADLSGDLNPMHVDPVAARRTQFGGPVVHGVHAALWVLDEALSRRARPSSLRGVRVVWKQPIRVDDLVSATVTPEPSGELRAALSVDRRVVATVDATIADGYRPPDDIPDRMSPLVCRELTFEEAAVCSGDLTLALDRGALRLLFPALGRWLNGVDVATLLAVTRLAGMVCPGRHSMLAEISLRAGDGPFSLRYAVSQAHKRYAALHLTVAGPTLSGLVKTFFRPPPQRQADLSAIAPLVRPGEFAGQRALVVGGSRGLGEVTAKLLAAGGAEVAVTYVQGEDDARRVAAEIGGRSMAFDCTSPPSSLDVAPTHLYYFATPFIALGDPTRYSPEAFARFCRYFVDGFAATVEAVSAHVEGPLTIFYPSTIYLDAPPPGTAEYCAAKAAGETLCRQLEQMRPGTRCVAPRLPRMSTDQTLGLLDRAPEPQEVILRALRALPRGV